MYDYIKGIYTYKNADSNGCFLTLESGGIGYRFELIQRDFDLISDKNTEIKLYCVLIHREDKMSLCGFLKRENRDMFNILTSVSGVGVKMALALLNTFIVSDIVAFVLNEDYKSLMVAKGVGQKLAQKIILELKGKFNSYKALNTDSSIDKSFEISDSNLEEAKAVLLSLGYDAKEICAAFGQINNAMPDNSSTEEILRKTLKLLSY